MICTTNTIKALAHKDVLSMAPLSAGQIDSIFETAEACKAEPASFRAALAGKTVILLFEKPSLRTRVSFEAGAAKLGATAIYMDHSAQRLGEREAVKDYGRNLERWIDLIVTRTFSHHVVEELAAHTAIPVINGLSDMEHPCQALADFFTMKERFGTLKGLKVAYVGDGNNVCHSLILGAAALGVDLTVISPDGYGPFPGVLRKALMLARDTGAEITATDEIEAVHGRSVVYTDTWVSMGQDGESAARHAAFTPYQVNAKVMAMTSVPEAVFMHCLPAHRGQEVTDEVIDSRASLVYDQAENRMHVQNALMLGLLGA